MLTYLSTLLLAILALLNLRKDWKAHGGSFWRYAVLLAVLISTFVATANVYVSSRTAAAKEKKANDQAAAYTREIAGLKSEVSAGSEYNRNNTRQFLATLDKVYTRLGELQTTQETKQLQHYIVNLQENLKVTDALTAQATNTPKARLSFGFYTPDMNAMPNVETALRMENGVVPIEWTAINHSDVAAKQGQIQVRICETCKFAGEPSGSIKAAGAMEQERIFRFDLIGTRGRLEKTSMSLVPPPEAAAFQIAIRYACQNCIDDPPMQLLTVKVIR